MQRVGKSSPHHRPQRVWGWGQGQPILAVRQPWGPSVWAAGSGSGANGAAQSGGEGPISLPQWRRGGGHCPH